MARVRRMASREESRHFGRRLQVELARLEPHPPRRAEIAAGPDTQQHVVGFVLLAPHVVQVVGDDEVEADFAAQLDEFRVEGPLQRQAVVLQLQEEAVPPEDVAIDAGGLSSQVPVVDFQRLGYLAAEASRAADQTLGVPGQDFVIDARPVVEAVQMGVGDEAAEVLVALPILGQEDEMERLTVGLALLVAHASTGDIGFHADDRLHALGRDRLDERHGSVKSAVIGDGHGVEAELRPLFGEVVDVPEPIEQAELGVEMEVDEIVGGDGHGR